MADYSSGGYNSDGTIIMNSPTQLNITNPYPNNYTRNEGYKSYELADHLGNILQTVSDRKLPVNSVVNTPVSYFTADVTNTSDYYPFGASMPNRQFGSTTYRYGYNGMEKTNEVYGAGNEYTTEFRQYDPRLGRWMSTDPITNASESPYASFADNPIIYDDPTGEVARYKSIGDFIRITMRRVFKKGYNEYFRENYGHLIKNQEFLFALTPKAPRLGNAVPKEFNESIDISLQDPLNPQNPNANAVTTTYYHIDYGASKAGTVVDFTEAVLAVPLQLAWAAAKIGAGVITLPFAGISALIRGAELPWGLGNRAFFGSTGYSVLGIGVGNYNDYNMFFMRLKKGGKAATPEDPEEPPGMIGIRVGVGKKRVVNFVDIFRTFYTRSGEIHLHINAASRSTKSHKIEHEHTIDIRNGPTNSFQ